MKTGQAVDFENYEVPQLAESLRNFYGALRSKKGDFYSKSAYVSIRSSINRFLTSPLHNRPINIMKDREYMSANQVFTGILRKLREDGLDTTKHKKPNRARRHVQTILFKSTFRWKSNKHSKESICWNVPSLWPQRKRRSKAAEEIKYCI